MLVAALVIAALMTWRRGDIAYLLVLAWAFAGIAIKHSDNAVVSTASWVATTVVLALVVVCIVRRRPLAGNPSYGVSA